MRQIQWEIKETSLFQNGGRWPIIYQPDQSITAALGTLYCHPYIQAIPNNTNGNSLTPTSIGKENGIGVH